MTVAQFYEYIKATELYTLKVYTKVYTLTVHFLNFKKKKTTTYIFHQSTNICRIPAVCKMKN